VLHLFRNNSPYTVIILLILTLGLKLQALGHPLMPVIDAHQALFAQVVYFFRGIWGHSAFSFTLLAVLLTFAQSLYQKSITDRHRLFTKNTYLPAFVYIIITSLHPSLGYFSAPLLVNWLVLGALDAVLRFTQREEHQRAIFNVGFMLGTAAVLYFPALAYLLFFLLALILLRSFRVGEWVVAGLGYLTPFYFAVCLLYLFDQWALVKSWPRIGISLPTQVNGPAYLPGLVGGCIILLGGGIYALIDLQERLPMSVKRGWGAIITLLFIAFIVCIFTPNTEKAAWICAIPAFSLLIVPAMVREKRSRFATFIFYFLLALVVYCQLTLRR
jgi:hypothetical protein